MKKHSLNIFDTIKSNELVEISADLVEIGIDQLIDNDLLKEIPILGIGIKAHNLSQKISDAFFTKKILKFFFQINDIPQKKREKFIKDLENKGDSDKAGEKILITLNRFEDSDKATIIGKLFNATILNKIDFKQFIRLIRMVDRAYLEDINLLKNSKYLYDIEDTIKSNLYQAGFLNQSIKDNREHELYKADMLGGPIEISPPTFEYKINLYGSLLIKFGFEREQKV